MRIGLALGAGVLIFLVPITYRRARWALRTPSRVIHYALSAIFLVLFLFYARYLWRQFVPQESQPVAPITYPAAPP